MRILADIHIWYLISSLQAVKTRGVKNTVTTIVTVAVGHLSKILAEQRAETVSTFLTTGAQNNRSLNLS